MHLTDLEFKCSNFKMDQYKVIAKETYLSLMVFSDIFIRGQSGM